MTQIAVSLSALLSSSPTWLALFAALGQVHEAFWLDVRLNMQETMVFLVAQPAQLALENGQTFVHMAFFMDLPHKAFCKTHTRMLFTWCWGTLVAVLSRVRPGVGVLNSAPLNHGSPG